MYDFHGDGSDWDLHARFIPWDGPDSTLAAFTVSSMTDHQWYPAIVYSSGMKEFLVAWENESQSGVVPVYIQGCRIDAANGTIFSADLTISHTTENRRNVDVAYNEDRNEYLLVYDNGEDILATRYSAALDNSFTGEFVVAGWSSDEIRPAVASCRNSDQYLTVWWTVDSSGGAVFARFLSGQGGAGNVYLIDDTTTTERNPDIACNSDGSAYAVAWETRYINLNYGIWGRLILPSEKMGDSYPVIEPVSDEDRTNPAVAAGSSNFMVAWEHEREPSYIDIHARIGTPYVFPWTMFLPAIVVH